jgi:hypothetical protein
MDSVKDSQPNKSTAYWVAFTIFGSTLLMLIAGFFVAYFYSALGDREFSKIVAKLGPLGDYVGGHANPMMTAFLIWLTYEIFTNQKKEMRDTVKAMQDQSETLLRQLNQQRFETKVERWDALRTWYLDSRLQLGGDGIVKMDLVKAAIAREFEHWSEHDELGLSHARLLSSNPDVKYLMQLLVSCINAGRRTSDDVDSSLNNLLIGQLSREERFALALTALFGIDGFGTSDIYDSIEQFGINACVDIDQTIESGASYAPQKPLSGFSNAATELRKELATFGASRFSQRQNTIGPA